MTEFTAAQARALVEFAEACKTEEFRKQLNEILGKIKAEAAKGKRNCYLTSLDSHSRSIIVAKLESLGYIVANYHDQRDGDWTTISW
jgi:hypothetical protein